MIIGCLLFTGEPGVHGDPGWYEEGLKFSTIEAALEAKIFNGESIHDLYNRGYNWLQTDKEAVEDAANEK